MSAVCAANIADAPLISVVIPARNERRRLPRTIASIIAGNSGKHPIEIVVVDDASTDGTRSSLELLPVRVPLRVVREKSRVGVARARNRGAQEAKGKILFITDSHVVFPDGWSDMVIRNIRPDRVLAATICDLSSRSWRGYGCSLIVPYMGTRWNAGLNGRLAPVQIASSAGTVIERRLFERLGGYDPGMIVYGAAEPEFSLRAWLSGAEICCLRELKISHRFQPRQSANRFLRRQRSSLMHNNIRFGLLYLSRSSSLQMLRHYAMKFPRNMQKAMSLVHASDVWQRRAFLQKTLRYDFSWFIDRFGLTDQIGLAIL